MTLYMLPGLGPITSESTRVHSFFKVLVRELILSMHSITNMSTSQNTLV